MAETPWLVPCPGFATGRWTGALTVAGQWRSFTAFPSILAIAVVSCAAFCKGSRYGMKQISMPSTFIDGKRREVKIYGAKKFAGSQKSFIGPQCRKEW
jgi:hypothetical protein